MSPRPDGFVPVCTLGQLEEDTPFAAEVDGVSVVLVRTCGAVHALHNACSHADVALSEGEVDDCHIECWLHGSRFDVRTGNPDSLPALRPVPVYAVHLDGDTEVATVSVNTALTQAHDRDPLAAAVPVTQEG